MKRLAIASLLVASTAQAEPFDTFGFGARAGARAGATTADSRGAAAAHVNPAGVARAKDPEVTLGWSYGHMALELSGRDAHAMDSRAIELGLAFPVEIGGMTHAFGLALNLPDQFIARIEMVPASEPYFARLSNDPHRLVVEPSYSLAVNDFLAIGVGASILADVAGNGITFNVGVEGGEKVGESALDVALPTGVAPMAGILLTPHPRVRLAGSYRGELDLGLKLDILANVDVAGVVAGDALISLRAVNYYTPHRVAVGAAVDVTDDVTVTAELAFQKYSSFDGAVPDLKILVALGISPPLIPALFPQPRFEDTFSPRGSLEWRLGLWALRAGYAFEPTPVPEQTGLTSFADNDRHMLALGAGVTLDGFQPILEKPVSFDLALQWHHLDERLTIKDQSMFPGTTFSSGGDIARAALTMTVPF